MLSNQKIKGIFNILKLRMLKNTGLVFFFLNNILTGSTFSDILFLHGKYSQPSKTKSSYHSDQNILSAQLDLAPTFRLMRDFKQQQKEQSHAASRTGDTGKHSIDMQTRPTQAVQDLKQCIYNCKTSCNPSQSSDNKQNTRHTQSLLATHDRTVQTWSAPTQGPHSTF